MKLRAIEGDTVQLVTAYVLSFVTISTGAIGVVEKLAGENGGLVVDFGKEYSFLVRLSYLNYEVVDAQS